MSDTRSGFMSTSAPGAASEEAVFNPGSQIGPWKIVRLIGSGGMGRVYHAERSGESFVQQVALKVMRLSSQGDAAGQFELERKYLARLEHPGIARMVDGGCDPEAGLYLAMELVEGQPIDKHLEAAGHNSALALLLLEELADAVAHAHARQVLHRDIKPDNVLVNADSRVRLVDFGIAEALGDDARKTGGALTAAYAAPEQLRGEPVTAASDIFQIGMVLHVLLTGELPERNSDGSVTLAAGSFADADLAAIARSALATDPAQRYGSVSALREDLVNWRSGMPVTARDGGALYRLIKLASRYKFTAAASVAALVALVGATIVSALYADRANSARADAEKRLEWAEFSRDESDLASLSSTGVSELVNGLATEVGGVTEEQTLDYMLAHARKIAQDITGSPEYTAATLTGIADFLQIKGDYPKSAEVLQIVIEAPETPPIALANAKMLQGRNLYELGRKEDSAEILREVIAWMRERPFLLASEGYANLLKNYILYSDDYTELPEALRRVRALAENKEEDEGYRSFLYNEAALLAQKAGDFAQMEELQSRAVELTRSNGISNPIRLMSFAATILYRSGDTKRARSYLPEEASVFGDGRGNIRVSTYYRWLETMAHQIDGDYGAASDSAREAYRMASADLPEGDRFRLSAAALVVESRALAGDVEEARALLPAARPADMSDLSEQSALRFKTVEALLLNAEGKQAQARRVLEQIAAQKTSLKTSVEMAFRYTRLKEILGV